MSSTSFLAQGRPSTITSDLQHIGALRYLNLPCASKKVVMSELFGSSASWNYPCTAFSLEKQVAAVGMACKISVVHWKGYSGLLTYMLR